MARTDRHGLTVRDRLALDAAKLYYSGLSQAEVAERLFVNRATVSKLLSTARRKGLVRTVIRDPREMDTELYGALNAAYDLSSLRLVVPVGRGPMDKRHALGVAGAELLEGLVQVSDTLGMWWSQTTCEVARGFRRTATRGVRIVGLNGSDDSAHDLAAWESAREHIERELGWETVAARSPHIYSSLSDKLESERTPEARAVRAAQNACRITVFSTSSAHALMARQPDTLSEDERARIECTSVGHICGHFIDADARICEPIVNQRTSGLSLATLRNVEQKVLVACGPDKVAVMDAILANRYANHLVTDVDTARDLVRMSEDRQRTRADSPIAEP